jgi:hypothetical protein
LGFVCELQVQISHAVIPCNSAFAKRRG